MVRDSLRSLLAGSTPRIALSGLLVVGVLVGGAAFAGVLGVPAVASIDNTFGEVTDETSTIETDLVVSNPNPIGIGLQDVSIDYTISMNSIEMAHGERRGVEIGTGNSTLELETVMRNDAIPSWWASHVGNGERTTIDVDATITSDRLNRSTDVSHSHEIETDLLGAFESDETRPVNADHPLTDDPVLYINETGAQWGTVSDAETPIDMAFVVYNPNVEPYVITELGNEITMNDVLVGAGETHETHVIPSRSAETVPFTTVLDNQRLDDWWVSHLDEAVHGHQVSELRIEFYVVVELPTGTEITVPLDELTYVETIETDIFDEGGDVGEPTEPGEDAERDREETDDRQHEDSEGDQHDAGDEETGEDADEDGGDHDDDSGDGEEATDEDGDSDAEDGDGDDENGLPL